MPFTPKQVQRGLDYTREACEREARMLAADAAWVDRMVAVAAAAKASRIRRLQADTERIRLEISRQVMLAELRRCSR